MFSTVLVANRGEIAVRVLRTCAELGIVGVAVHTEPDAGAFHVRVADAAVALDGPAESYLDIARIVRAAREAGADAIHPGYGFLAENAEFARAVTDAGLVFIGPPAEAIEVMGDKVAARQAARAADVPQVPGTDTTIESADQVRMFGAEHGYPLAIKASHGGGGRGMRLVHSADDAERALEAARREAEGAFGRSDVYLERYLDRARHVEVQVFADTQGTVRWLGDRDCSVQRRHQKLVEESPAPGLPDALRHAMGEASVRLARTVGYVGAGTVEYLVEGDSFFFLEMNTRIQVEHPVTEQVLGMDLIAEQLAVASGQPLSIAESGPAPRGHALEVRVNAENTDGGLFVPTPGRIVDLRVAHRAGLRFDSGYEAGDEVPPQYDSMIGKLIAWAPDRRTAIRRMLAALDEFVVAGVPTTLPAARTVLEHPDFERIGFTTNWLESSVDLPAMGTSDDVDDAEARDEVWVGGRRYIVPFHAGTATDRVDAPVVARRTRGGGSKRDVRAGSPSSVGAVRSPMQGTVVQVNVAEGTSVTAGDLLFVVEAMKMENPVRATGDGTVESINVASGDVVTAGETLAVLGSSERPAA